MADETKYTWPEAAQRSLIGKSVTRVDGPDKVSGRAKYTYDTHRPGHVVRKGGAQPNTRTQRSQPLIFPQRKKCQG